MPYVDMPSQHELGLLRAWRARNARALTVAWALLGLLVGALALTAVLNSTSRALLTGEGQPVTVRVDRVTQDGACSSRYSYNPRYRYDVTVQDPGSSGRNPGETVQLHRCAGAATGSVLTAYNLPNGKLTLWTTGAMYRAAAASMFLALVMVGLLWLVRREERRVDAHTLAPHTFTKQDVDLEAHRLGWVARPTDPTQPALQLGRTLITTDGRLRWWRLRRGTPVPDPSRVTLVFVGPVGAGAPVLLVDGDGRRHWRTLGWRPPPAPHTRRKRADQAAQ